MATRWNHVVLPVGREQDRVDAGVGGARCDREGLIGIVAVHREPNAIEDCNRRLEDYEVQPGSWLAAVPVSARVGGVVERIVQRIEITAHGDGRPRGVVHAVVAGRRRCRAVHRRHAPSVAVGVVLVDPLRHIGLTLTWRIEGERPRRRREAGLQHRLDAISIRGEALSVPGCQIFKQVRELHGCTMLEVAVGPLIGLAR